VLDYRGEVFIGKIFDINLLLSGKNQKDIKSTAQALKIQG